jgi:hypothetical protein
MRNEPTTNGLADAGTPSSGGPDPSGPTGFGPGVAALTTPLYRSVDRPADGRRAQLAAEGS